MWESGTLRLGAERTLAWSQGGEGPDLVLVHGALTTQHDWLAGPAGALSARYRVTIVDRPGHGGSRRPRFAGTPRDQARQIADGLAALNVDRPLVCAHSYGGLVALALAEQRPEAVAGLVLLAPIAFPEVRAVEHMLLAPRALPLAGPVFSWFAQRTPFDRTLLAFVQREMFFPAAVPAHWQDTFPYRAAIDAMVFEGEDAASVLPGSPAASVDLDALRLPVHVLTGTADRIVEDERQGKALARLLRNARLTEIEGAGHMLHHSHPETIRAALEAMDPLPAA
ncbi:MAG: alpha/beta hydrolase [Alphaproteobacteria bacterium]|nr:alpha/beta hydrolase [Alphaproteobacteria bacterium]MBV9372905.1 alpha/beta hydrolase [Alphaproteobacteria bacterium]MBV9902093.1 alpha/beta hydrolase [Alphaproteobacteria bacterium]